MSRIEPGAFEYVGGSLGRRVLTLPRGACLFWAFLSLLALPLPVRAERPPAPASDQDEKPGASAPVPGQSSPTAPKASVKPAPPSPSPEPGAPVVEAISGIMKGPLTFGAGPDSSRGGSLQVGSNSVPLEEVLRVRFVEKLVSTADALLFLRGDDEVFASIKAGDESELKLLSYAAHPAGGGDELTVPLEHVRGIGFPRRWKDERSGIAEIRRWLSGDPSRKSEASRPVDGKKAGDPAAAGGEDRVLLNEGAELSGLLQKVDAQAVLFQSATAGDVRLPLEKVRAISIAALAGAKKDAPKENGLSAGSDITTVVQGQDGSVLTGRLLSIGEGGGAERGALRLKSPLLGDLATSLDRVKSLTFRGGRCQYLSDLEPARVSHREDLFSPWELRRDLATTGDPIRLRGQEYKKGLGMHSHCRADYTLGGRYSRFLTVAGMDDAAKPDTTEARRIGGGIAVFRVYLDDQVAFEKELSWSDAAVHVDLPLEGVQSLGLELDYGKGYLVLDRGDWADARILKKG